MSELEFLAKKQFPSYKFTDAECLMLGNAPHAQCSWCGPSSDYFDATNDPENAADWELARTIRAELLRWLLVDRESGNHVSPSGIRWASARTLHLGNQGI